MNGPRQASACVRPRGAFTLIELLVVIAIIAVLASLLLPVLARAQVSAQKAACVSNLHQLGLAWQLYLGDHRDRFPDRRDLKLALPGGYKPWTTWPKSDPRSGWAAVVLRDVLPRARVWDCPALASGPLAKLDQIRQLGGADTNTAPMAGYWMWRFDRPDDPVPADNFWGRTVSDAVASRRGSGNPGADETLGPVGIELMVDPYFPNTITALPLEIAGWSAHRGGRNRLMLDGHAEHLRDLRTR